MIYSYILRHFIFISDATHEFQALLQRAASRTTSAYRPKTRRALTSNFTLFLQFLRFSQIHISQVSHSVILAFIEFLLCSNLSYTSIQAYLSSIKSQFKMFSLPHSPLDHHSVAFTLHSIALNIPVLKKAKGIFYIPILQSIVHLYDSLPSGPTFKVLFLTAFFAFSRLSNLVPSSSSSFSPFLRLCQADFIPHSEFASIVVKWIKTLQKQSQFTTVQVPVLHPSPLCPVTAIQSMIALFPLPLNAPLFALPQGLSYVPLTESKVRKTLASIVSSLGLDPISHSFHCFHRSGASLAFNSDVSLQAIQKQGTWSSDSVWSYIISHPLSQSSISLAFKNLLQPYFPHYEKNIAITQCLVV